MDAQPITKTEVIDSSGIKRNQRKFPDDLKKMGQELRKELKRMNADTEVELSMNFVDSTWDITFSKVEKDYWRTIFSFHALPVSLSKQKLDVHMKQQLMRSCLVDKYASKKMIYQNFFLEPGCGNVNNKEEENIVDCVYAALKKLGAKETKNDFFIEQMNSRK